NASTSGTLTQTVNKAACTTAVVSAQNPSLFGQSVTFTATVSATSPGAGTPTGTVVFKDGATTLNSSTLNSGAASYTNSTSSVTKANSATAVVCSPNPSVFGQPVICTATVTAVAPGAGTPTGTVQFSIDGSAFGSPVNLIGGVATLSSISSLSVSNHTVTAAYA